MARWLSLFKADLDRTLSSKDPSLVKFAAALMDFDVSDPEVLVDMAGGGARELLEVAVPDGVYTDETVNAVENLLSVAKSYTNMKKGHHSGVDPRLQASVLQLEKTSREKKRKIEAIDETGTEAIEGWDPRQQAKTKVRRTRRSGTEQTLAARDRDILEKWSAKLVGLLKEANATSWMEAQGAQNSQRAVSGLAGSARGTTLRIRVRAWMAFKKWLEIARGRSWPEGPADAVDYLWDQQAVKMRSSFPKSLAVTISWMEARAGVLEQDKISNASLFKCNIEKAQSDAEIGILVKKAPSFPTIVIRCLEKGVVDEEVVVVLRVMMWCRLVKIYGVLRADDLQRLDPGAVSLQESGLAGKMVRTKTTGAGKRVRELVLFIPRTAWVQAENWMEVGYHLWRQEAPWQRDFFLPRACCDLRSFENKIPTSGDIAA